ncbi:DUF421 domain-containing protein [Fredinandcohnia humi]
MPNWIEVGIRSLSVIIGLFLIMKLLGKKQLGRLSFFEYILGITIGSIAASISLDIEQDLPAGITSILVWLLFPHVVSLISLKSKRFSDFAEGKSTVFIKDGKILEEHLKKEKYTADELLEQLRKKDVFQVADVEFAALEPSGDISVLLKKAKQPLTVGDIFSNPPTIKEPQAIIMDGTILDQPLAAHGFSEDWLKNELKKKGVKPEEVFLAQVDNFGELNLDLYDDKVQNQPPVLIQQLLASLRKNQLDFKRLALQAELQSVKEEYIKHAEQLKNMEESITPYFKNS